MERIRRYGVPYKGSKNKIAEWVVASLPAGRRLVDLFAGGCAVTHCAMRAGRYAEYLANDVGTGPRLFADAAAGKYRDERRWISCGDFFRLRGTDAYVRWCWSFGDGGESYLYSREIEPYKRALHYAVVMDDWGELGRLCPEVAGAAQMAAAGIPLRDTRARRLAAGWAIVGRLRETGDAETVGANPLYRSVRRTGGGTEKNSAAVLARAAERRAAGALQGLERLERLQGLDGLSGLDRLEVRQGDYRDVEIRGGDVVYCDIPYRGTVGYNGVEFDHAAFYAWALGRDFPVFVSEYAMPEGFACIGERTRLNKMGNKADVTERLFVQERYAGEFRRTLF